MILSPLYLVCSPRWLLYKTVTTWSRERDEVLTHIGICTPSSRKRCDAAKLTILLSFMLSFSFVSTQAGLMELPPLLQ